MQIEAVNPQELLKVRNQVEAEAVNRLASNAGLAAELANAWALRGDWRTVLTDREKLKAVTAEQVQDVARRYLVPARRTVASLVRSEGTVKPAARASRSPHAPRHAKPPARLRRPPRPSRALLGPNWSITLNTPP